MLLYRAGEHVMTHAEKPGYRMIEWASSASKVWVRSSSSYITNKKEYKKKQRPLVDVVRMTGQEQRPF